MFSAIRQLKACESAVAATIVTAAIMSIPLFAETNYTATSAISNDYYGQQLVQRFMRIGADSGVYDNLTVNSSAFDLVSYMSDGCYRPSENGIDSCKQQFGPYYNLKQTMDSGALKTLLMQYPYFSGVDKLFPAPTPDESTTTKKLSENQQIQLQIDSRSRDVWDFCQRQSEDRMSQNRCYQRNIRLTLDRNDDIEGNVL